MPDRAGAAGRGRETPSPLGSLLANATIYGFAEGVTRLLNLAVLPIYAHVFTVAEFGVFGLVSTLAVLTGLVFNLGLNNAIQRFYLDRDTSAGARPVMVATGLLVLAGAGLAVTVAGLAMMYPVRSLLAERYELPWLLIVLALVANIPLQILQYCQDVLRSMFAPWRFSVTSLLRNVGGLALGLLFVLAFEAGLEGLFLGQLLAAGLTLPLGLWFIRRELAPRFDAALARKMLGFGYPFVFAGLAYWFFSSIGLWMLTELSGNTEVGLYGIAGKFALAITFVTTAFGQAWAPVALRTDAEDPDARRIFGRTLTYWFFALTLVGLPFTLFSGELLRALTPAEYWPAAGVLSVLATAAVLLGTTQITVLGLSLAMRSAVIARCALIAALASLAANALLIPALGALGAGFATLIAYGLLTLLYLAYSQMFRPIPLETGKLLATLALLTVSCCAGIFLNDRPWGIDIVLAKTVAFALIVWTAIRSGIVDRAALVRVARSVGLRAPRQD